MSGTSNTNIPSMHQTLGSASDGQNRAMPVTIDRVWWRFFSTLGNGGTGAWSADPVSTIGAGLSINGGTLAATSEWTGGRVTLVGTGLSINDGTLVADISSEPLQPGPGLAINSNTIVANYQADILTEIGTGLMLAAGTITANYQADVLTTIGAGLILNSGTISINQTATVAGAAHITIAPASGVREILINAGTAATTLDFGPATELSQELNVQFLQGATAQTLNLGTSVAASPQKAAYTATATAAVSDFLSFIGRGTLWALREVAQNVTIA